MPTKFTKCKHIEERSCDKYSKKPHIVMISGKCLECRIKSQREYEIKLKKLEEKKLKKLEEVSKPHYL